MNLLLAEDDPATRKSLELVLADWGYAVTAVADGKLAWQELNRPNSPRLLLIDWQMPLVDGIELCRRVRATSELESAYILILTVHDAKTDIAEGLDAGADDFLPKPFDEVELRARLAVGARVLRLQQALVNRVHELEEALANIKRLQRLLPVCGYCKKIRSDQDYWQQVEEYFLERGDFQVTHGICPECYETVVGPQLRALNRDLPPYPPPK